MSDRRIKLEGWRVARKRMKLRGLDYELPEYWNRLLNQDGLSVNRGRSKRLLYVGGSAEVSTLAGVLYTDVGRVQTSQSGVDDDKE